MVIMYFFPSPHCHGLLGMLTLDGQTGLSEQKVIVPIVGSILVIFVFMLMCLVKWQRYWQVRAARKRRRLVKGFLEYADYEGIPA
jgi:hypothetical protein